MGAGGTVDVTPSARRLTESLRDIGYDFLSAVADIVDNSVSAGATRVDVVIDYAGAASRVVIADDGAGMTERSLQEALRFGTRREYGRHDLGRFGLGLKTASLSQCRHLSVVSRHAPLNRRIAALTLDLDRIAAADRWVVFDPWDSAAVQCALDWLDESRGTVVVWERLDRVLPERAEGTWARRKLQQLAERTAQYLAMVFHRFLEGDVGAHTLTITVNGEKVPPWNPFALQEEATQRLDDHSFEVRDGETAGSVALRSYILPNRSLFSSASEFERLSGPKKWNRQQGLYIYRANRLIQSGGWSGLRAADEHTKLARAALDFGPSLDHLFRVDVAKMRVTLPAEIRTMLERPIHELCRRADRMYRHEDEDVSDHKDSGRQPRTNVTGGAVALRAAAMEVGEYSALNRIMDKVKERSPDIAEALGWGNASS
jgi:hypothetical protein